MEINFSKAQWTCGMCVIGIWNLKSFCLDAGAMTAAYR